MGEEEKDLTSEQWLSRAQSLVPAALESAKAANAFTGRWKSISSKLDQVPTCLSDLSSHPFFSRHSLCREILLSFTLTLSDSISLAGKCRSGSEMNCGKLQMQSDIDALCAKLDLNLRDCSMLLKTGVLAPPSAEESVRELLARLQIGHAEARHRVLDGLLDSLRDDSKAVLSYLTRCNISAIVQMLTATAPKVREKSCTVICLLAESGSCENLLVSEGVLPPLIRLADSGSLAGREKAVISLQHLSMSSETARLIVGHGGVPPLVEICRTGDSVSQSAATGALKNISAVPDVRQSLADEGIIRLMINLLNCGILLGAKEYAAECLQNLTSTNDNLRRAVIAEGGIKGLLAYLDGPLPQESAVAALRNLVGLVLADTLMSLSILPRLIHVLKCGSIGAQQAAVSSICKILNSSDLKRVIGEFGFLPILVKLLESKSCGAREVSAQAIASLMSYPQNCREVKKNEKSVPNLVQLLDPIPQNPAKKYAVSCLLYLSSSKKCKKLMISHGAIGYLKKLCEMDVPGAKILLKRIERGKLKNLFSRN